MSVHYPAGTKPRKTTVKKESKTSPLKGKTILSAANRGRSFEDDINSTNEKYLADGLAAIHKRPTPITVVKVDYSHGAKITEAYFSAQSTTDYNGVYRGKYIDFEAKSTRSRTSFPLNNIAPQQVRHLRTVIAHGGIAFFLIELAKFSEIYLLDAQYVCDFYESAPRKSIPFSDIRKCGHKVQEGFNPRVDYLPVVDKVYFE